MKPLEAFSIRPDEQEVTVGLWRRALRGESFTTIREYTMADLSRETVEASYSCIRDAQGEVVGAIQVARDISLRAKAEEAYKKIAPNVSYAQSLNQFGSWEFDVSTGVTVWSEQMYNLLGFNPQFGVPSFDDMMKKCHPRDAKKYRQRLAVLLEGGKPRRSDLHIHCEDGSTRWLSVFAHGERGRDGNVIRLLGTVADFTERKAIEHARELALQRSEELFRLFNLSTEMVIVVGPDGYVRTINPAWSRTLGYSEQELLTTSLVKYVHPDDAANWEHEVEQLYANTGIMRVIESRWRCKNGAYRWISWNAVFVKGQGIYGVARDMTEAKLTNQALRESEERLEAVIAQMPAGIVLAEAPSGRMILSNEELDRIIGQPLRRFDRIEEFSSPTLHNTDNTQMAWEEYPLVRAVLRGETTHQREVILRREDGTQVCCSINAAPVRNGAGEPIAGIMVLDDITELKQLQQQFYQSQKMEGIGRLAGGIAHDFNNLLSIIMGHAELVNEELAADSPSLSSIKTILRAVSTAADLTQQMLVFARRQPTKPQVICPNDLMQTITGMLEPLIGDEIVLNTHLGHDVGNVRIDPNQLEQVVVNLVVNACDAMPRGGRLTISTKCEVVSSARLISDVVILPGTYVLLSVSDTGMGMDSDVKARLFEPFFTTKDVGKGTGLGLATVYGIVKQHGGHIVVDTAPERGTTFTILLAREHNAVIKSAVTAGEKQLMHAGETVLIVEDEPLLRELFATTLRKHGYEALTAEDGVRALEIADAHPREIHLLLTDAIMPNMGGTELAARLRKQRPGIRILLSSGYTEERLADSADPLLDASFLPKPFTPNGLLVKVREALAN
jgi:PAS domain S-box-containing protein